jgi:hypothetical protein
MKHSLVYRLAACLLFLFFAGHTAGSFSGRAPAPAAAPVLDAMKTVHFDFHGSTRTFYEIFFAFSLVLSLFLFLSAVAAWRMSSIDPQRMNEAKPLAWWLFAVELFIACLAWNYFFVGPAVIATLAAVCLGIGALLISLSARSTRAVE